MRDRSPSPELLRNSTSPYGRGVTIQPSRSLLLLLQSSIRIQPELECLRTHEEDGVALPSPGGRVGERGDQLVIGLGLVRRTGPVFDLARDEDDGVAGDRELALAALAP